jgi:hypothetical protein
LVDSREEDNTNQKFDITTKPKTGTYNTLTLPSEPYSKKSNPLRGGLNFRTGLTVSSRAILDPGPNQDLTDENIEKPKPKEWMNWGHLDDDEIDMKLQSLDTVNKSSGIGKLGGNMDSSP